MAVSNVVTKYRPIKIGFLVRDGEISDVLEVARISSFLVGGIHNVIIPVSAKTEDAENLIKNSDVDILHPISKNDSIDKIVGTFTFLRTSSNYSSELFREDWTSKKKTFIYLDVFNTIEKKIEKYFRGSPSRKKSNAVYVKWEQTDTLNDWCLLSFGTYTNDTYNLKQPFEPAFVKGMRSHEFNILAGQPIPKEISGKITPNIFGISDLKSMTNNRLNPGVYIGEENNFQDLVCFWNLRALVNNLVFLPIANMNRVKDFVQEELLLIEKGFKSKTSLMYNTNFYYSNIRPQADMEAIVKMFPLSGPPFIRPISYGWIMSHLTDLPADYLNWEFSQTIFEKEDDYTTAIVNLPEKKFISDDNERGLDRQTLVVFIDSMGDGSNGAFLNPPNIKTLNEFYSREISFDPWKIRASREGISVIIDLDDKYVRLTPIDQTVLIKKLFEDSGIKAELSQPGLLAQKIITKLGSIDGARVFKIGGVRDLFENLKSNTALPTSTALEIIYQRGGFDKHKKLYIESRNEDELKPRMAFDFLLKKEFLRGGLELYCKNCNLENWLNLKAIDDKWECEYCGHNNLTSTDLRHRGDWKFRKSGLFAKDNNQEGSIPVILTLLFFKRVISNTFPYTTSLKLNLSSKEVETDFSIVQYKWRQGNRIEIVIGECKSAGGKITQEDANNLKMVANKLREKGYEVYITFSKTADEFLPEEIEIFKKLNEEGYLLILLTNKEMEPYNPYWDADDKDRLPNHSVVSLEDAQQNSFHRYLKPKPPTNEGV